MPVLHMSSHKDDDGAPLSQCGDNWDKDPNDKDGIKSNSDEEEKEEAGLGPLKVRNTNWTS